MAENGKFSGREVVIVEAARLPVGRGHEEKGYYKDVHASNLLAKTYSAVIERVGIDPFDMKVALDIDRHRDALLRDLALAERLGIRRAPVLYLGTRSGRILEQIHSALRNDRA